MVPPAYMQVGLFTEDMKHFSDYYKPYADLEAGWCNVPNKIRFKPTEMMIVAYHNNGVVYAYKGIYNGGLVVITIYSNTNTKSEIFLL